MGIFTAKRMRSETLCSMCSTRSFPRVGQGVGQSHRHRRCGSTFSGSGMVTFCAAGNNERVSKRRNRATGRRKVLPPDGSLFSQSFPVWVKMWVKRKPLRQKNADRFRRHSLLCCFSLIMSCQLRCFHIQGHKFSGPCFQSIDVKFTV